MKTTVRIKTEWIKLDSLLKLADVAESGGFAKMLIRDGAVFVNGEVATGRSKKINPGDVVEIDADPETII
ncbi:MAG: RNA-binding S4 domain-containing protein, partial [bacterium]|nr:RNA-binding S4 domain-containing protein [bacterium]